MAILKYKVKLQKQWRNNETKNSAFNSARTKKNIIFACILYKYSHLKYVNFKLMLNYQELE